VTNTETSSGVYTHDRWKAGSSGCKYTFSTANVPTTITIPASDSLIQVIEGINLETATYTVSWSGTSQGKEAGGTYADSGFTVSCTAGTNLTLEFDDGTLTNVQMEKGTVATPFEHRFYGDELARCLRYYWYNSGTTYYSTQYQSGYRMMHIPFPVPMRATPTSTVVVNTGTVTTNNANLYQWKGHWAQASTSSSQQYSTSVIMDAEL
jgi:hypothetical protein